MFDKCGDEMLARLFAIADDINACQTLSCSDSSNASRLASCNASPSCFHGDHSFSGSASHDGLGRLPAVEVGSKVFIANRLSL
jgi:hypothetical protein